MSRFDAIRYFELWQVDPMARGKEQDRFLKLKTLLAEAAHYLCLPSCYDPFLTERMSCEKALGTLARAWGMKASATNADTDIGQLALPVLARHGQELVLLLPYNEGHFLRFGVLPKAPKLIKKEQLNTHYKELFLLYKAAFIPILNTPLLNKNIRSFLPSTLIALASLLKLMFIALLLGAACLFFAQSNPKNCIALLSVGCASLILAVSLDFFSIKSAHKNAGLVKLGLLSILFNRVFSLELSEYVHRSKDQILTLRATLLRRIDSYFLVPIYYQAWALCALNFILLIILKPLVALLIFLLTLCSLLVQVVLKKRLHLRLAQLQEDEAYLQNSLASLQASFSMAHSLKCLWPLFERLSKDMNRRREHARQTMLIERYLEKAQVFVPLLLCVIAVCLLVNKSNKAFMLLALIDALFLGLAFVTLMNPQRSLRPLSKQWVDTLNQLRHPRGHRVQAVDIKGNIELVNVSFSYEENPSLIFQGLSLTIRAGHCYGITGPSGSGKSTLLKLLMGQEEITRGQVIFDGQDLRSLELRGLRQHFGVISQDTSLFSGSILDNILCGRSIKMGSLRQLFYSHEIFDILLDLPLGMQTYVFKDAQNLSRVQVVLILLARALIHQPQFLFMDEILKGMPPPEQQKLINYVQGLPMTRIITSHHELDAQFFTALIKLS